IYAENALRDVDEARLRQYFTRVEGGSYRIQKFVRDLCIFVQHDLARDPPFSRLDLACCRNVLLYFDPGLQPRRLGALHYGLAQPGFLVLGRSEGIAGCSDLFSTVDEGSRIYARTPMPSTLQLASRGEGDSARRLAVAARAPIGVHGSA